MKKIFFKSMLLLCALIVGSGSVWADKVTAIANIATSTRYYIGATLSSNSTDYYLQLPASTGNYGNPVTSSASATVFIFEATATANQYKIKIADTDNYLHQLPTDNGKIAFGAAKDAATFTASDVNSNIRLSNNSRSIERNNTAGTARFGSYANSQTDLWLEVADSRTAVNVTNITFLPTSLVAGSATTSQATAVLSTACASASVSFESLDEDVATCTAAGVITAVAKGTARIKATLSIPANDPTYKVGTATATVNFSVTNPTHKAAFYVNGEKISENDVPEEDNIEFPDAPANRGGKVFMGWATAEIDGTVNSASVVNPSNETMGNNDIDYYAVFAKKSDLNATFSAAITNNLTQDGENLRWTENNTGIVLYLEAGRLYTDGTPYTFTVTGGNTHYMEITAPSGYNFTSIVVNYTKQTSGKNTYYYKVGSVSTGASVSSNNSTLVSTISFTSTLNSVKAYSTSSQIRATSISVSATKYEDYCTTIKMQKALSADTWATFSPSFDVTIPEGVDVHYATYAEPTLTAHLVTSGKIKAGEGVLLKSTSGGTYSFFATIGAEDIDGNALKGTVEDYEITSSDLESYHFYVLANNGGIGFYRFEGTIPANKAYLRLDKTSGEVAAPAINFIVDEENNATSIETISSLDKALKFIENGRLLIQKDGVVYDALGRVIR